MTDISIIMSGDTAGQLRIFEDARREIAGAETVDTVKRILALATGLAAAARQATDKEMEAEAAVLKLEAERKLGQLMAAQKETVGFNKGGRPKTGVYETPVSEKSITLAEAGIDKNLAKKARNVASMSEVEFAGAKEAKRKDVQEPRTKPRKKPVNELPPQPPEPAEAQAGGAPTSSDWCAAQRQRMSPRVVIKRMKAEIERLEKRIHELEDQVFILERDQQACGALSHKFGENTDHLTSEREFEIKFNGAQSEIADLKAHIAELEVARNGNAESPASGRSIRQVAREFYGLMQELEPLASSKGQKDRERVLHAVMQLAMTPESLPS